MKYFLIHVLEPAAEWQPGLERRLQSWVSEMDHRGVLIDGAPLRLDVEPMTIRRTDAGVVVSDGPFAETKEQIAGFDLIETDGLDEAIAAASAHPTLENGAIEIRPVAPGMATPAPREPRADRERYLMLVCWDQSGLAEVPLDELPGAKPGPIDDWIERTGDRDLHGWHLQPPAQATTVRRVGGATLVLDGPFAETKEQIGGYDFLECADRDEAIAIASAHSGPLIDLHLCADGIEPEVARSTTPA